MLNRYVAYPIALLRALLLALPLVPNTALAQANTQATAILEEVMVTARKREENLQDTPISITAISGEAINQAKLLRVDDLGQRTPNLQFRASDNGLSSSLQAYIRGVGQQDFALTVDPGVGTYVDGVYLARTVGANIQLADVEQITILRGPQGTLFGKNTIGGAIDIQTRRPSGETDFTGQVTAGEYGYFSFDGYLEFPITDTLAGSVAVLTKNSDGWQERDRGDDAGNDDMWSIRGHLDANFTDTWNSHLTLDYTDIDQNVYPQVLSDFFPDQIFPTFFNNAVAGPQGESCCEPHIDDIDSSEALNQLDREQNQLWGISWINTWDTDNLTLKSITGYRDMKAESYRDADNSVFDYFSVGADFDVQQFSQEFILSNAGGSAFDWVVGLYYLKEDGDHFSNVTVADGLYDALAGGPLPPGSPPDPIATPLDLTLTYDRTQKTTSYAAFFHSTWHMSERARLSFAARYTYDEKELDMYTIKRASQTPVLIPGATDPTVCSDVIADGLGSILTCKENWDEVTPKLGIDYDVSENVLGYAHVSTGFRSGVYNGRPTATDQVSVADPETLVSYEIGAKSQLWDNRVQINGALFYNEYDDRQFLVNRPSGSAASALALVVDNAADSTLWGGELEVYARPLPNLTLRGGVSYLEPEYKTFESVNPETGELEDLSGRPFTAVPDWTANLLVEYAFQFNDASQLLLRGDLAYTDEIFYADDDQCLCFERLNADSYTIYNAGITYISGNENWEVSVFGRNLGDKREIIGGFGVNAFGTTTVSFTEPRRFFVSLRYRN
ncbi:MAG: TonB-dependent receptor [Pseudomonadota bacterium]